jgi:hypothetical protein
MASSVLILLPLVVVVAGFGLVVVVRDGVEPMTPTHALVSAQSPVQSLPTAGFYLKNSVREILL